MSAPRTAWVLSPRARLALATPAVCAVINTTPDSFSDGGAFLDPAAAADHARACVAAGAALLDLGAASTRPGAPRVSAPDQLARLLPALRAIRAAVGDAIPITIDTTLARVASAAFDTGADAVNDVSAGHEDPAMLPLCARLRRGIILMHRLTTPDRDRYSTAYTSPPVYADVVAEVSVFLAARASAAVRAGIAAESIALDPGLGFGKSVEQNLALICGTARLADLGHAVVSGLSRKSFVAPLSGLSPDAPPAARLAGTIALTLAHVEAGARILRVHDVSPITQALHAWRAARAAL